MKTREPLAVLTDNEDFQNALAEYLPALNDSGLDFSAFLEGRFIDEYCEYCRMPETAAAFFHEAATLISRTPLLKSFFDFCAYQLKYSPPDSPGYTNWPTLEHEAGKYNGAAYMLAAMSLIPDAVKGYCKLGVDEIIIRDTMLEFSGFCANHISGRGVPGILREQLQWLKNYRDNKLFRLGRMEFKLAQFHGLATVCRNRANGQTMAFLENDVRLDSDGYVVNSTDPESWTSVFTIDDKSVSGNPVSPMGFALKETVTLELDKWEVVLRPGDMMIDMHIPPGGGLSPEATRDSFQQAAKFFTARHPEKDLKAICCYSWIFNTQLEELMPKSNLAEFMRQLFLFPIPSKGDDGMFFVFCTRELSDTKRLPRDTSLQRALLEIVESGRKLRSSGMFFLLDDLEYFGSCHYRRSAKEQC